MSPRIRELLPWIAATFAVAALVHLGSVHALPRLTMARALTRLGAANTLHFGTRPDATSRAVVRPSPDLLYAVCPYDLDKGPLRVIAAVPHGNYWSVSAFDAATNNFFVRNDRQITGDTLEILLARPHQPWPPLGNALERVILYSPTQRGLILFRTVIARDAEVPALETILHKSSCETVAPPRRIG